MAGSNFAFPLNGYQRLSFIPRFKYPEGGECELCV